MTVVIKEKLDYYDFMEANFPKVLKPVYTKPLFIVNIAFAFMYLGASIYIFYKSFHNGIELKTIHYSYMVFGLLFALLSWYIIKREKRIYHKLVEDINNLETEYHITDRQIKVINKKTDLTYPVSGISQIENLPKWLVVAFDNDEKIAIYKPNILPEKWDELKKILPFE